MKMYNYYLHDKFILLLKMEQPKNIDQFTGSPITIQTNLIKEQSYLNKDTERLKDPNNERPRTPGTAEPPQESIVVEKIKNDKGETIDRLYTKGRFIGKVLPL